MKSPKTSDYCIESKVSKIILKEKLQLLNLNNWMSGSDSKKKQNLNIISTDDTVCNIGFLCYVSHY